MIVKNEAHIIKKTLTNICQNIKIDTWIICDTGSTDNTVEEIQNFFDDLNIEGMIYHDDWKSFSANRNLALERCVNKSDYILIFDADDFFEGHFILPNNLDKDCYLMNMSSESRSLRYQRKLLIKNNAGFYWRSVLHEFIDNKNATTTGSIEGDYYIVSGRQGDRSKQADKYLKDAIILKTAFEEKEDETLLPRYAFYCAQSYRDSGDLLNAIEWYQKRIDLASGWGDEIYCSYLELGLLYERDKKTDEAILAWLKGVSHDPLRAECWYHLSRIHSWSQKYALAYSFAKDANSLQIPKGNRLFIGRDIYRYWVHYECCFNAFKLGNFEASYHAFKQMLEAAPDDLIQRISSQIQHYKPFIFQDSTENFLKIQNKLKDLKIELSLQ